MRQKQQNLQLLYILASNSANKPSFQNLTKKAICPRQHINRVIDQNIQKLLFFTVFASYIASILKPMTIAMTLSSMYWLSFSFLPFHLLLFRFLRARGHHQCIVWVTFGSHLLEPIGQIYMRSIQ